MYTQQQYINQNQIVSTNAPMQEYSEEQILEQATTIDDLVPIAKYHGILNNYAKKIAHIFVVKKYSDVYYCSHCGKFCCTDKSRDLPYKFIQHVEVCVSLEECKKKLFELIKEKQMQCCPTQEELYVDLVHLFNDNCIPLNIYGSQSFQKLFTKYLHVDLQSLSAFRDMFHKTVEQENQVFAQEFRKGDILAVSCAVDIWTVKRGGCAYLGIAVSTIDKDMRWKVGNVCIEFLTTRHTNVNVIRIVHDKLLYYLYGYYDIIQKFYTTDGGLLSAFHGIYCNCHVIEKCIDILMKIEPFKSLSSKCFDLEHLVRINNMEVWNIYLQVCEEEYQYPLRLICRNPTRWDNMYHVLDVIFKQYDVLYRTLMMKLMSEKQPKNPSDYLVNDQLLHAHQYISKYLLPKELISNWSYVLELIEETNKLFSTSDRPVMHEVLIRYIHLRNDLIEFLEIEDELTTFKLNTEFMIRENVMTHVTESGNRIVDEYIINFWKHKEQMEEENDINCFTDTTNGMKFERENEKPNQPMELHSIRVKQTSVEYLQNFNKNNISIVGDFIIQFLGLLDYRINKCFHDICYIVPMALNPQLMGTVPGQNPYAFWAIEQMLYQIPVEYVGHVENQLGNQQYYQTMPIPEFDWKYYPKIKELLEKSHVQVKRGYTVRHEINKLWTFQLPDVYDDIDILDFYQIYAESFPRICILVRIFLVNFASEAKVERMFSQAGLVMNDKRNRLTVNHFGEMTINKINQKESK